MRDHAVILLVEDREDDIVLVRKAFEKAFLPNPIYVVRSGEDAIAYLKGQNQYANREEHPLPDLILLDIHMPRFTGLEFLRWLREKAPDSMRSLPVVIVTASGLAADLNWARALGVQLILLKPIRWSTFWQQLEAAGVLGKNDFGGDR